MIFDYREYIDEMRGTDGDCEIIEDYEQYIGPIGLKPIENITDGDGKEIKGSGETWYRELVRPFPKLTDYEKPDVLNDEIDWGLLSQLLACTPSSRVELIATEDKETKHIQIRLKIHVESSDKIVDKFVDEIWELQVYKLFRIYIKEQIANCVSCHRSASRRKNIYSSMRKELEHWKRQLKLMEFLKSSPSIT